MRGPRQISILRRFGQRFDYFPTPNDFDYGVLDNVIACNRTTDILRSDIVNDTVKVLDIAGQLVTLLK